MGIGALLGIAKGEGTPEGYDPGMEADGTHPTAAAPPPAKQKPLAGAWKDFLNAPGNHAALIQFGIKALQPISPGQSPMGHLANALGEAGEARSRNIAETADTEMKRAQTDYYSGRSAYYASGGPRGGLTASQLLNAQWRERQEYADLLGEVLMSQYRVMDLSQLPPEQQQEALTATDSRMSQLYPGMVTTGGAPVGTANPLGAAVATPATPVRKYADDGSGAYMEWNGSAWTGPFKG